ncbi:hypothetical protein PAXRUDRAFT_156963 [Paxillus rubicundulus Ve08.2h10]|uniref:Uncharacterized protein n=1 Tax=Paxillus rubicundulus Ve08.2h10 TaxID=930991 RepID=A0A0D0DAS1_9AGAM|nr:hypothetical protein PAXRUDRAFT_156963 [Paxillus rubicundulus Ve08.2h10]
MQCRVINSTPGDDDPTCDSAAWSSILDFANGTINSLPEGKNRLCAHFGTQFIFTQWKTAFDAVLGAKNDASAAITAVNKLWQKSLSPSTEARQFNTQAAIPPSQPTLPELIRVESELMQAVDSLHSQKCIHGTRPTLEDLLNPSAGQEIGDSPFRYPHGDVDIIKEVKQRLNGTENGLGSDNGSESSDEEGDDNAGAEPMLMPSQGMDLCQQLEALCLQYTDIDGLEASCLQHHLQKFRVHLRKDDLDCQTQTTLDCFFVLHHH